MRPAPTPARDGQMSGELLYKRIDEYLAMNLYDASGGKLQLVETAVLAVRDLLIEQRLTTAQAFDQAVEARYQPICRDGLRLCVEGGTLPVRGTPYESDPARKESDTAGQGCCGYYDFGGWDYRVGATRDGIIRYITKSWTHPGTGVHTETLRHCTVDDDVLWTLVQSTTPGATPDAPPTVERWIGCHLLDRHWPTGDWGYKSIGEDSGLAYYTCPLEYLDAATEPRSEQSWGGARRSAHYHQAKARGEDAPRIASCVAFAGEGDDAPRPHRPPVDSWRSV